jgi:multidrug efflux pump subunit AcrA (membrane-fusion protein)
MIASVGKKLLPSRSQLWVVCVAVLPLIPGTVLGSDILEQKFDGIVVPRLWVQVVPQVDGVISRILVAPGQRVSKGDILFEMDPEAFAIDVRIAQSELAEARARLTMAEDAAERQAELVKQNATAKQLARSSQIEVEIARAIVARNESALAKAQLALSRTRVAAPLSGTVGRPRVAPGAFSRPRPPRSLRKSLNLIQFWCLSTYHMLSGSGPLIRRERPLRANYSRGPCSH